MTVLELFKDLLFPRKCVLCQGILTVDQTDLCHECRTGESDYVPSERKLSHISGYTAVWFYEDQPRDSLLRYKFSGKRHYAQSYGRFLAMQVKRTMPAVDMVTWVPVSAKRRRQRGYDQAELLARALASELELPTEPTLKKVRDNPAQSGITDPSRRKENVKNVYRPVSEVPEGKTVLLVDDILTTGATACECARVLRGSGADRIFLAVMASGRSR